VVKTLQTRESDAKLGTKEKEDKVHVRENTDDLQLLRRLYCTTETT
jgi:hypothetical protein